MRKITLPKNHHKGLYIYCKTCRTYNPKCKHLDRQFYRLRIHIPGTKNGVKSIFLTAQNYNDAVIEAVNFENDLALNGFQQFKATNIDSSNDYNIGDAVIKYRQYLTGDTHYAHLKRNLSKGHIDESIRFCWKFIESLDKKREIKFTRPSDVKAEDVSDFFIFTESIYNSPKTFNKCFNAVRAFFEFLIEIENINIKNPFRNFVPKALSQKKIEILTQEEFNKILECVDTFNSQKKLGGKGEIKSMYRPYLKDGFKLFLLTGGRREEVINLKWSNIYSTSQGIKLILIENLKVQRIKKNNQKIHRPIGITVDLEEFLNELGMNEKIGKDDFILFPDRDCSSEVLMNNLSKGFTYYKNAAGIKKDVSLRSLRKTYLTWQNQVLGDDTRLISSHSSNNVLEKFYLDPTVLSAVEISALKVKIFGNHQ